MNAFRKQNKVIDLDDEVKQVSEKLRGYDLQKDNINEQINYLDLLETYLRTKTDYSNIAAPSTVGITDGNIVITSYSIHYTKLYDINTSHSIKN